MAKICQRLSQEFRPKIDFRSPVALLLSHLLLLGQYNETLGNVFECLGLAGGSLVWENSNLGGKWRSLAVSATTSNFLDPEDLGFQLTYRHPDFRGIKDPKRTELNANFFNTRNLSAVFTGEYFMHAAVGLWLSQNLSGAWLRNKICLRRVLSLRAD